MPESTHAAPSERLPWLPNSAPAAKRKPRRRSSAPFLIVGLGAAALLLAAWLRLQPAEAPAPPRSPTATVRLPAPPVEADPSGSAAPAPVPPTASERAALRPAVAVGERLASRPQREPAQRRANPSRKPAPARPASAAPADPLPYDARAWNSGVPGRIIQLGAYPSSAKAQAEWRRVYQRYPLLRPLSPRVIRSKVRGKTRYRLQLGTFSQAHSELLCQRLRTLGEGCIVLGLPKRGRS